MLLLVGDICCIEKFNKFAYKHIDNLKQLHQEDFGKVEIIISRGAHYIYDKDLFLKFKKLKQILLLQIGNDNVDIDFCKKNNIEVKNFISNKSIQAVAQMTVASLVLGLRQGFFLGNFLKKGIYQRQPLGFQLEDINIGIMGFGRIGKEVYKLLKNFPVRISVYDIFKASFKGYENENIKFFVDLNDFLSNIDYLLVHIPGFKENIGLLDYDKLKNIRGIVNFSRAGIVVENDILKLLNEEKLDFYITDVIDGEPDIKKIDKNLLSHEKVFVFPHIGANTYQVQKDLVEQVVKYLMNL